MNRRRIIGCWIWSFTVKSSAPIWCPCGWTRWVFRKQLRRNKVAAQSVTPSTPAQLQMAIMAALAGLKDAKPNGIIKAVLKAGLETESNAVYQEFVSYGIDEAFWRMVAQGTGYQNMDTDLAQLATHLLMTASTRTMRQEFLAGLQMFISSAHQAYCYDFVSDWMHGEDAKEIYDIAIRVESELKLPQRFMKLQVADLVDTEIFPCVNEVILVKLMTEISDHIIDVDTITQTVEKRRTCVWYDDVKNYYEGILQVAKMQAFFKEHSTGFHTVEPAKIWKEYTKEYYIMDTYYREFHKSYSESLKYYHEELSDLFTHVMEKVEGLYVTWFLGQLGKNWTDACSEDLQQYGRVLEVDQQVDFYRRKVASSDSKVYVIISDAMRYEVAATLAEQLRRETQAQVDLKSMQGIFPTITKFGMAALLPHKTLTVQAKDDGLAVLADGLSTDSYSRDKVLKTTNPRSVTLKYSDFVEGGLRRPERQALTKSMDVVYIYHDTIDEAGHLESGIFSACDTAIEELKNLIRIITSDWGSAHIIITSDHGFLYTDSPLKEDDKVDKTTASNEDVEIGRRYAIVKKGVQPNYLLPVQFLDGKTDFNGFAPRESIRIKKNGGGLKFVHGGISLQEMVVPVIDYRFLRNESVEYKAGGNQSAVCQPEDQQYDLLPELLSEGGYWRQQGGGNLPVVLHGQCRKSNQRCPEDHCGQDQ